MLQCLDTNRKLTRYSNTVERTKSLLLWWEGQTEVDQANVSSIETLVTEAEEIFHQEHAAWLCMSFDVRALLAVARNSPVPLANARSAAVSQEGHEGRSEPGQRLLQNDEPKGDPARRQQHEHSDDLRDVICIYEWETRRCIVSSSAL